MSVFFPVSQELVADSEMLSWDEIERLIEENTKVFRALPPEEQARILAEKKAAYEAQRCEVCGCHPDEHGDG